MGTVYRLGFSLPHQIWAFVSHLPILPKVRLQLKKRAWHVNKDGDAELLLIHLGDQRSKSQPTLEDCASTAAAWLILTAE